MRRNALILFLIVTAWMVGDHPVAAQDRQGDPCPLKWRKDPEAAAGAREAKKQRMRDNGVPERYLHLLDKMECVACIETAPDTLHVTVLYNDDEHAPTLSTGERDLKVEFKWSAQSERQLREQLRNGQIQSFYVWIHEKRCYCCPDFDQKAEDAQDWNDDTGLNMDEAQGYDDPDDLGPLPDDLKPPPPGSQTPPPPIERFDDLPRPSRRVLQATCRPCEELARQWTNESSNLNFLWDRKIEQMRRVSIIANARTNRSNEIERLEYEQRFDSTRTYDNLQKIKELKEVNEAQESDQDSAEREIERLDREIRETEMRMEELMQKFLECEKRCQTALTQASQPQTAPAIAGGPPSVVATASAAPPKLTAPDITANPPSLLPPAMPPGNVTFNSVPPPAIDAPSALLPIGTPAAVAAIDPVGATAACPACQAAAEHVDTARRDLQSAQNRVAIIMQETATLQSARSRVLGDPSRLADLDGQLAQLNRALNEAGPRVPALQAALTDAGAQLAACNKQCTTSAPPTMTNKTGAPAVPELTMADATGTAGGDPVAACPACAEAAEAVKGLQQQYRDTVERRATLHELYNIAVRILGNIEQDQKRASAKVATGGGAVAEREAATLDAQYKASSEKLETLERDLAANDVELRNVTANLAQALKDLNECNKRCTTAAASEVDARPGDVANFTPPAIRSAPVSCSGPECADAWKSCIETNSCTPIDEDCGVPGTCSMASGGDPPAFNLMDPSAWGTTANADIEQRVQIKIGELVIEIVIRPVQRADIRSWFNPLGLLARRLADNVDRWRGSAGPRPLLNPRDVATLETYSNAQAIGLPKGVHVLLSDRGGSTGKTLAMQVLNLTGQPVRLSSMPFAIEPIKQQAQAGIQAAFNRIARAAPVNVDLAGYCVEFLKTPPSANQIFRLAPAAVQKKFAAMSKVLRSAYRVQQAGLLQPDSNPAAYTDAIKQWAIWAVEQNLNETTFTDAFLGHTRKNVEAAGRTWSKPAEEMMRKVSPNRWRDIVKVLQGAGLTIPR